MSNDFEFEFEDYDPLEAKPITKKSMVIFFVIDTSESMKGKKIDDLNRVMREIIPQLAGVGGCNTELKYAVLSFSSGCKWITSEPMIVEDNNNWKDLNANGITDLGMAFEELTSMLSRKKFLKSPSLSYAPVIFLMTDGYPTDNYKKGLEKLKNNCQKVYFDEKGNFINAESVDSDDKLTIIPVTEKSGSRTAGKEPHPLCDNLRYLAGDYAKYYKDDGVCNALYISQMEKWVKSDFCHDKVRAIYLYLKKGTLIKNLVDRRIIKLNESNQIDDKENIQGIVQTKAFVRFIVRFSGIQSLQNVPDECWKDRTLQECYIKYVRSQEKEKGMCYLTGNTESISYLHSKKIRNEGDGAKLISANDSQNFTYRGRFVSREEAFAVGDETSQKVHNALKWIIRKQGAFFDTLAVVTWESNRLNMPRWNADTASITAEYENVQDEDEWDDEWEDDWDEKEDNKVSDGNEITAQKFYRALRGYGKKIDNTSFMMLLGFDAATPGRLSMVEEKTLDTARYLENIKKWHESCEWIHEKKIGEKWIRFSGMVGVKDVADILFGIENKGKLEIVDKNSKKLYAEAAERLIPCIWNGHKIPYDYVNRAVIKASSPLSYKERKNWERVLTLACSLVKKYKKQENEQEEWSVALDKKEKDRSYLYGRLLAVADRIEYRTYDEGDKARVTNAKRYMSTFSQRPFETWKVIEESIQPYMNKLGIAERRFYENLLDEICNLFEKETFLDNNANKRLDGLYLLGFHSQSYDLKKIKKENSEDKKEEE